MILFQNIRIDRWLAGIALLALFLNGYNIWAEQYANAYYTMTVGSMLQSWSNFFFGALDSAGSVTVDKPPLTFWIQGAFAKVFGLYGWSVILPQALAGVGSVLLIYGLVKPGFGVKAARIGSLVFALTPIAVAVARTNNIDSMLVFTLLLATWLLFRGAREGRAGLLIAAFGVVGLAFNMKMLQAYMVLPAFYGFYLLAVRMQWRKKLGVLAGATAMLAVVSLSWAVVVDSIPADNRPYIGSSETNSVLELAFGYNGLSRLTGDQGPGNGPVGGPMNGQRMDGQVGTVAGTGAGTAMPDAAAQEAPSAVGNGTLPELNGVLPGALPGGFGGEGFPGGAGGMGGMFGTGEKGPLRLFQSALSGQASWLIPFALTASVILLAGMRRRRLTQQHIETLFWLAWLLPCAAFFSIAGFFHHYYLIMLAPPIAVLTGAGWTRLYETYRAEGRGWQTWLLPGAVAGTAVFQWYVMQPFNKTIGQGWSIGVLLTGIITAVMLAGFKQQEEKWMKTAAWAGLLVLLVGPLYWAATPITYGQNSMLPQAGPGGAEMSFGGGRGGAMPAMGMSGGTAGQGGSSNGDLPAFPEGMDAGDLPAQPNGKISGDLPALPNGSKPDNMPALPNGMTPDNLPPLPEGITPQEMMEMFRNGAGMGGMPGGMPGMNQEGVDEKTLAFLQESNTGETYLFATTDYTTAAPYIIDENEKVISMGGFSGQDPVYTPEKLEAMVKAGELKYFLLGGGGMRGGSGEVTAWIQKHGKVVPTGAWKSGESAADNTSNTSSTFNRLQDAPLMNRMFGEAILYEVILP
ncbi:ArnT family glycosyltransferase [Paenibacillus swuensis]